VYKRYNALYNTLYNIKIHKSLEPLKTLYILLCYKEDIDVITGDDGEGYGVGDEDTTSLFNYVIIYILYDYIENIHQHIIHTNTQFKRLIPAILEKCLEIKKGIDDDDRIPNNLKLMFLKKNDNVFNLYRTDTGIP
jgi:hypothetical protein